MAKCVKCGKKGLFLRLDQNGFCSDCAESTTTKIQAKQVEPAELFQSQPKPEQNKGFQSTLYPNAAGLYPKDILVIEYAMFSHFCVGEDNKYQYWKASNIDINKMLEKLCADGFVSVGSISDSLQLYKIPDLKASSTKHGLKNTGKKDELIGRLIENVPADVLAAEFPRKPYLVTDAGRDAIKDDGYVMYMHRHSISGLDVNALNRLMKGNTKRYRDFIWGHFNKTGLELLKSKDYGLYSNLKNEMARFLDEEERYKEAASLTLEAMYYQLSGLGNNFDITISAPYWFPYEKSLATVGSVEKLKNYQEKLDMDDVAFQHFIKDCINRMSAPFHIFTNDECVQIILLEMEGRKDEISKIYLVAQKRLKKQHPKINFDRRW